MPLEIMGFHVGEQDSSELEYCLLNPNTRNIKKIVINEINEVNELFEILMDTSTAPRKEYLFASFEKKRSD